MPRMPEDLAPNEVASFINAFELAARHGLQFEFTKRVFADLRLNPQSVEASIAKACYDWDLL